MLSSSRLSASARDRLAPVGGGDLQHLARHRVRETVDAGDPVLDLEDLADLLGLQLFLVVLDGPEENALDLARPEP